MVSFCDFVTTSMYSYSTRYRIFLFGLGIFYLDVWLDGIYQQSL